MESGMPPAKRPISILLISLLLIITTLFESLITVVMIFVSGWDNYVYFLNEKLPAIAIFSVIQLPLAMICGIYILRGKIWARNLYIGVAGLNTLINFIGIDVSSGKSIAIVAYATACFVVLTFFLMRRPATAFFYANSSCTEK